MTSTPTSTPPPSNEEIAARAKGTLEWEEWGEHHPTASALAGDIVTLVARMNAALDLHSGFPSCTTGKRYGGTGDCEVCPNYCQTCLVPSPCATVRALLGEETL